MSSRGDSRGNLFIVSGPSGAGKTTIIRQLMESHPPRVDQLRFSVSHTTRKPRQGEEQGQAYHFVSEERFAAMREADEFLEWALVHDYYYGTSRAEVEPHLDAGIDVLLDIDVEGTRQLVDSAQRSVERQRIHTVFVLPPGPEVLRQRLTRRNLDDARTIERRLRVAIGEVERFVDYDYVMINDQAGDAGNVLASIILDKRHRCTRMRERVEAVLRQFQEAAGRSADRLQGTE